MTTVAFVDWIVACPVDKQAGVPCIAQQQLVSAGGTTVLIWTIERDPEGTVHAVWRVPTGVALTRGLIIDLGDSQPGVIPFSACDARLCTARAVLKPDYLKRLLAAEQVSAGVTIAGSGKQMEFHLSSRGLGEALSRLSPP